MPCPVYASVDMESIIKPEYRNQGPKTKIKNRHEACSYGLIMVWDKKPDGIAQPQYQSYRGKDAAKKLLEKLVEEKDNINKVFENKKP